MRKFLAAAGLALAALVPAAACAARPPALVPANDRPPATVPAPSCAYPRTLTGACPR